MTSPKQGTPLSEVDGFPVATRRELRDQLSVTTAEEFTDLASRMPKGVEAAISVDADELHRLQALIRSHAEDRKVDVDGDPYDAADGDADEAPAAEPLEDLHTGEMLPDDWDR